LDAWAIYPVINKIFNTIVFFADWLNYLFFIFKLSPEAAITGNAMGVPPLEPPGYLNSNISFLILTAHN
jgi:hypothetical protein